MKKAKKRLLPAVIATLLGTPAAHAGVDLIATGGISGAYQDLATDTAGPLENGIAGNRLGGMGSGLAYAGGNTFVAVPDRGPNANSYNSAVNDTVSYINRFQALNLSLAPSEPGSALPFTLTPFVLHTTLLWSRTPLVYGTGAGLGVGSGVPALNAKEHRFYFTGRSDNFDPTQSSADTRDARLDPESVRVSRDGDSLFVSDEYGPYLYQFDRRSGERIRTFRLPANLAVAQPSPQKSAEIADNTSGRLANKGMEGLAITPDGKMLIGMMQSPLIQDGGKKAGYNRIVTVDVATGATHEYAYGLSNIGSTSKPKYGTVSDVVAINGHGILVDERDGNGFGDDSTAVEKHLYRVDLSGAEDVSGLSGESNLAAKAVPKSLFLDLVAALNAHGISSQDIPAKLEGIAFGPDVVMNGVTRHTLFVANDNDFLPTVVDGNHPDGRDNPNQYFVFAFDDSDLPGFVPQRIESGHGDRCLHDCRAGLPQDEHSGFEDLSW